MIPIKYTLQGLVDNKFVDLGVDSSTNALAVIDYEHHEIHGGSHFFVHSYQDIPQAGDVLDFTWSIPESTKQVHWQWTIDTESEVNWFVYEDVIETNPLANDITILNSNRCSKKTSMSTMKYELQADLATANLDTDVSGAVTLMSGISGSGKQDGIASRSQELILCCGVIYCLRAIAGAAGYINFDMQWYEHTVKNI